MKIVLKLLWEAPGQRADMLTESTGIHLGEV